MGEEQRGTWQDVLTNAHAAFEDGTDFTLAVEEEFALLDPETLGLVNRFEDVKIWYWLSPESSMTQWFPGADQKTLGSRSG